jgi:hypothetical protein
MTSLQNTNSLVKRHDDCNRTLANRKQTGVNKTVGTPYLLDIPMSSQRIREALNETMSMNTLLSATLTRHPNIELHFSQFLANGFVYIQGKLIA